MSFGLPSTLRHQAQFLIGLVLLPIVALIVWNGYAARERETRRVQDEAYRLARVAAAAQQQLARNTDSLLATLMRLPSIRGADRARCAEELADLLQRLPAYQNAGVIDSAGAVACSARPVAVAHVADRTWFRNALGRDALSASGFEPPSVAAAPSLVFARRTPADPERMVLFAAADLDRLREQAESLMLPAGSSLNMVDDTGRLVARNPDHRQWVGKNVKDAPIIALALANHDGASEAPGVDGITRLFGYHRVELSPGSGLTIALGMPLAATRTAATTRLLLNLGIVALVAAVTMLAAHKASTRLFTERIEALLRAARRLSAGDLSATTGGRWKNDELGELARTFDSMAWVIAQRTEDLRQMMESLRALAARIENVREEERKRISREIHDELGQTLTGIRMDLDRLEERIERAAVPGDERSAVEAKITSVRMLVGRALDTARRISRQLRPSVLDVLGVRAAIEWQLDEFQTRSGAGTELVVDGSLDNVDEATSTALFRIFQEALTNIMRHAQASAVTVRIADEDGWFVMEVMDNGRGFAGADTPFPTSLGLLGMRERAALLGGTVTIASEPGRGTIVTVRLPHKDGQPAAP